MDETSSWTFYCDEAGNVGPDFLNTDQPFHVAAGWLIKPAAGEPFVAAVQDAASKTQGRYLKGSVLLKRDSGQKIVADLLETLVGLGALPFYIIAERRFCLAGKAVEVYFDPFTNPAAGWLPTIAVEARNDLWEVVSNLPVDALEPFARAYRDPSPSALLAALPPIVAALRDRGHEAIARTFEAARGHIDDICRQETFSDAGSQHWHWASLNLPIFLHALKKADAVVALHEGHLMKVVHHEINGFDRVFAEALARLYVSPDVDVDIVTPGGTHIRGVLQTVRMFEVSPSRASLGVQAADLLASTLARLSTDARRKRPWSSGMQRLAELTLPALMERQPLNAGMLCRPSTLHEVILPVFVGHRARESG